MWQVTRPSGQVERGPPGGNSSPYFARMRTSSDGKLRPCGPLHHQLQHLRDTSRVPSALWWWHSPNASCQPGLKLQTADCLKDGDRQSAQAHKSSVSHFELKNAQFPLQNLPNIRQAEHYTRPISGAGSGGLKHRSCLMNGFSHTKEFSTMKEKFLSTSSPRSCIDWPRSLEGLQAFAALAPPVMHLVAT